MKNTKKSKSKSAFTLAEVLITLTIIGVIAAMVIPNLIQRHFEAEMVSKFKKNYNILNNAVAMAIRDNGPVTEWDFGSGYVRDHSRNLANYLKPYLKIQKECGSSSSGKCFADNYKNISGLADAEWTDINSHSNYYKFILEDGTSVAVWNNGCNDSDNYGGSKNCGSIFLDLNNTKGPNKFGHDAFFLTLTEKNIRPKSGNIKDWCSVTIQKENSKSGMSCAGYILLNGNMDYLHK